MNMKTSVAAVAALLSACTASYSADTTADVGQIEDGSHVVVSVDHTRLVNGTTEVIANDNGTASISTAQSVQKPNCVRVSQADGSTGKTIVLSFRYTSDELSSWSWNNQFEFTIEYDGVSYDAITVGESDSEGLREVSTSLSWANGSKILPAGISSPTYWDGVLYDFESPGGLEIVGDGNGESCSTYTYTSSTGTSALIATVPFVDDHKWDWSTQVTNAPSFASTDHEHDHLTSDNGEWRLVQMDEGSAVVMPSYYYGENAQQGVSVKFYPYVPIEDVYDMNATQRTPMKLDIFVNGQLGAHADGYVLSRSPMYLTNKVIKISGIRLQDTISISYVTPFLGNSFSIMGVNMTGPEKKTLVSADYLRTKLADVSVNVQTAEDARVALTNLITILKNL
jgi:hypothetical protein